MSRLVDLSHVVAHGLVTYPGLPPPTIGTHLSREESAAHYAPGTTFHIGRIEMVANTGTYVDAPFHRFADGADLAALPLERLVDLPGVAVDAPRAGRAVRPDDLPEGDLAGHAVIVRTGWWRHWGRPEYGLGHPFLPAGRPRRSCGAASRSSRSTR